MTKSRMITPPQRIVRDAYVADDVVALAIADRPRGAVHQRQLRRRLDVQPDGDEQQRCA